MAAAVAAELVATQIQGQAVAVADGAVLEAHRHAGRGDAAGRRRGQRITAAQGLPGGGWGVDLQGFRWGLGRFDEADAGQ